MRSIRTGIGAALLACALVAAPLGATTAVHAAPVVAAHHHHKCTKTSSGTCIRGGEFCPQADYGEKGWDAEGRKYICKGSHTHPHWELP